MPPYLAGRDEEKREFHRLLKQETILENLILTGLRGVGKTVLLETFKPEAQGARWLWAGADLSESTSVSEEHMATRLLTDLAIAAANVVVATDEKSAIGFGAKSKVIRHKITYDLLRHIYDTTPGLISDKLKAVLEFSWAHIARHKLHGLIFAYDEAQNMSDHPVKDQFPLSLLLDVFQSIQRKDVRFMLILTGLPTLFPKLVETRTFTERMFRVVVLGRLSKPASRDAILRPIQDTSCPLTPSDLYVNDIVKASAGYPYFIQFICREVYDIGLHKLETGAAPIVPMQDIIRKLDVDFFAGRWARVTERQRDLLTVIAYLRDSDEEFTVQEIVDNSRRYLERPFSASHVNQMLVTLASAGIVYKNRHGRYSFAVPLFGQFILRQQRAAVRAKEIRR